MQSAIGTRKASRVRRDVRGSHPAAEQHPLRLRRMRPAKGSSGGPDRSLVGRRRGRVIATYARTRADDGQFESGTTTGGVHRPPPVWLTIVGASGGFLWRPPEAASTPN